MSGMGGVRGVFKTLSSSSSSSVAIAFSLCNWPPVQPSSFTQVRNDGDSLTLRLCSCVSAVLRGCFWQFLPLPTWFFTSCCLWVDCLLKVQQRQEELSIHSLISFGTLIYLEPLVKMSLLFLYDTDSWEFETLCPWGETDVRRDWQSGKVFTHLTLQRWCRFKKAKGLHLSLVFSAIRRT